MQRSGSPVPEGAYIGGEGGEGARFWPSVFPSFFPQPPLPLFFPLSTRAYLGARFRGGVAVKGEPFGTAWERGKRG